MNDEMKETNENLNFVPADSKNFGVPHHETNKNLNFVPADSKNFEVPHHETNENTNFVPPDSKNFGPWGKEPADVNPGEKPPFYIGPPMGQKPQDSGTKPSKGTGESGNEE
jgi:hypothetical protein